MPPSSNQAKDSANSAVLENDAAAAGAVAGRIQSAVTNMFEVGSTRQRVCPYRLIRELGRGGMGTVYLAERDDEQYRTHVAVSLRKYHVSFCPARNWVNFRLPRSKLRRESSRHPP